MNPIRIVSWIHGVWGAQILLLTLLADFKMPRTFGSLEAYLSYMSPSQMSWMLLITALISAAALRYANEHPRMAVLGSLPQQLILTWGVFWSLYTVISSFFDGGEPEWRTFIGSSSLCILAYYHGMSVRTLWTMALLPREAAHG